MPPTDRFVISFAAEPPQEPLPYGRWADTLAGHFRGRRARARHRGRGHRRGGTEIAWFPDRTYGGRTYMPAVARTSEGFELFGFVSFTEGAGRARATSRPRVDFTSELAEANPDWKLDLNDEVIGSWRGEEGKTADMTLVWGVPLVPGGALVTAELANLAVDQCELVDERFTLIAPDNYRGGLPRDQAVGQGRRRAGPRVALRRRRRRRGLIGDRAGGAARVAGAVGALGRGRPGSRSLTSASVSGKWQAARLPVPLCSSGGSSWLQISCALGQRVWKRQADGGLAGTGDVAGQQLALAAAADRGLATGTADSSAPV